MNSPYLTINQVAKLLEVSTDTLRRLEQKGKISPKRVNGQKRLYSKENVKLLKIILGKKPQPETSYSINEAANVLGVSIDTLRRWDKDKLITGARTTGGHRRYSLSEIEKVKSSVKKYQPRNITFPITTPITTPTRVINENALRGFNLTDTPILYRRIHIDQQKILFVATYLFLLMLLVSGSIKAGRLFGSIRKDYASCCICC